VAWLHILATHLEEINADVSTVTAAGDRVWRVTTAAGQFLLHFELQSGPDSGLPRRINSYNALLAQRHQLPVLTVVILLRREAHLPALNGVYTATLPGEGLPYHTLHYRVLRVWEFPVATVLTSGLGVLPLAPLCLGAEERLPEVIATLNQRFQAEAGAQAAELWTATRVLMGLRYDAELIETLLQGVHEMKDSTVYQAWTTEGYKKGLKEGVKEGLKEGVKEGIKEGEKQGALAEARRMLILVGTTRCGPPAAVTAARIHAITDAARLEDLVQRALLATTWDELWH
jgi:predicted transposase YdaD